MWLCINPSVHSPVAPRLTAALQRRGAKARWSRGSLASPVQALSGGGEDRSDVSDTLQVSCRRTKYSSEVTSSPRLRKPNPRMSFTDKHRHQMSSHPKTQALGEEMRKFGATLLFFDFSPLPSARGTLFSQSFTVSFRLQNPEYLHCSKKIKGTLKKHILDLKS